MSQGASAQQPSEDLRNGDCFEVVLSWFGIKDLMCLLDLQVASCTVYSVALTAYSVVLTAC